MEGSWKGILAVLVVLAGLAASGSSYQIIEGPRNATVLEGSEASFNCTISPGWSLIMWALNGTVVLSITPKEPIITNKRFTSVSYEEGGNFISEMIIHDVQLSDAGHIKCSLQNSDRDGSAFLSVQVMGALHIPGGSLIVTEDEPCNVNCCAVGWSPLPDIFWEVGVQASHSSYYSVPEPDDPQSAVSILTLTPQGNGTLTCVANMTGLHTHKSVTVNLTVVQPPLGSIDKPGTSLPTWAIILLAVSFSLLFILIIVLIIIFCCCCVSGRENKESSYQSEVRKSASMKTDKEAFETKSKSGNENYGYVSDIASLPPRSSEASVPEQRSSRQPHQSIPFGYQKTHTGSKGHVTKPQTCRPNLKGQKHPRVPRSPWGTNGEDTQWLPEAGCCEVQGRDNDKRMARLDPKGDLEMGLCPKGHQVHFPEKNTFFRKSIIGSEREQRVS